jgi:hypothetical protein
MASGIIFPSNGIVLDWRNWMQKQLAKTRTKNGNKKRRDMSQSNMESPIISMLRFLHEIVMKGVPQMKYILKVSIAVYESSDDMTDVFSIDLKTTTANKNAALGSAQEIQASAQQELMNMKKD